MRVIRRPRRGLLEPLTQGTVLKLKAAAAVALAIVCAGALSAQAGADPVIAAAGDIACSPSNSSFNGGLGTSTACRQKYTSDLLVNAGLAAVLALGDNQYEKG